MILPQIVNDKIFKSKSKKNSIVALDGGVRTFQTAFSEREVKEFNTPKDKLERYYDKIDLIKSMQSMNKEKYQSFKQDKKIFIAQNKFDRKKPIRDKAYLRKRLANRKNKKKKRAAIAKGKRKRLLKKKKKSLVLSNTQFSYKKKRWRLAVLKYYDKINNMIDGLHWTTITYLRKNYSDILLPKFNTSKMVTGTLHRNTKKSMNALKHYRFKKRMLEKTQEITNLRVHVCNESYSTKTCTRCGELNEVGSSKIFVCRFCELVLGRDVNAPRGIFIKHVEEK